MSNERNILVVENDDDTRRELRECLEAEGYKVELAESERQARARDRFNEFMAVFLNRSLADGSAYALLLEITSSAPATEIVLIADRKDFRGAISAMQQGAADFLIKPVQPLAVQALLRRLGRLKEAERRANDAERRAKEADRLAEIGHMAAVLAHEGRNELHQLAISLSLLKCNAPNDPPLLESIALAEKAQDNLGRLFDDLRCYGGGLTLDRRPLDLRDVWRKAWAKLESLRHRRRIALSEYTGGVDMSCWGDGFRLEQAFRNLFENALEACPDPIRIDICCSQITDSGKPALRIVLRDNGPGMTTEQRRMAFYPFYTTKSKGTGLGLAIVNRVFEAHGGSITIAPSRRGTEFVIRLPLEPK